MMLIRSTCCVVSVFWTFDDGQIKKKNIRICLAPIEWQIKITMIFSLINYSSSAYFCRIINQCNHSDNIQAVLTRKKQKKSMWNLDSDFILLFIQMTMMMMMMMIMVAAIQTKQISSSSSSWQNFYQNWK
mgnify:CR=1 FL=1